MSKRKDSEPTKAEPRFSNNALKDALAKAKAAQKQATAAPPPKRAAPPPPPPRDVRPGSQEAEDAFFRSAMREVEPIPQQLDEPGVHRGFVPSPTEVNEDAEALAQLAELVETGQGIDLADTDEYVEGGAPGIDPDLVLRLRRGDFSVQAHVDLHGMLVEDARVALERFLVDSRRKGLRCVLIVHGRGLHSKDQIPVLKSRMQAWLSRGKLAKIVLAFATARPQDGGAGAMYLLLRR